MIFFQLFSTIKVKPVDRMIRSAYFCVTLHFRHRKLPFIAILTWFLILGKIQDGSQDNDHIILFCWRQKPPAAPPPIKYTSSCWEDQRFSTESKIVSKYCNISKTLGSGSTPPPPHPLYQGYLSCESSFIIVILINKGLILPHLAVN